ncbi:AI-2E family transporter [Arsenicitalea aurantiaca]|uniref:AI-2E family transporter n=1 Tax=Arsenicitalea aurantiaca TaxID=1783274 RepID=UPI001315889E|nr:AI-2E family transporter [Arsenicitalea aurantiaca]
MAHADLDGGNMTGAIIAGVAAGAALFVFWQVSGTLLLIFAGILLAAVLDAAVLGLGRILPIARPWRLAIVVLAIILGMAAALLAGGLSLWDRLADFISGLGEQVDELIEMLEGWGVPVSDMAENGERWREMLPDPGAVFGQLGAMFGTTFGVVGDVVIALFLGLFFAVDPAGYRDGVLKLIPVSRRARLREVLDETGGSLRRWLLGQLAMMALVAVSVWALLFVMGIENALLLGLIAGLLNFIPFLGPLLATIPVVLSAVGEGGTTFVIVIVAFLIIQNVEGYLISPFIQQKVVHLPAAWSLAFMAVMGALFGGLGVALAAPLYAVLRILTLRLYVEDQLEKGGRVVTEQR